MRTDTYYYNTSHCMKYIRIEIHNEHDILIWEDHGCLHMKLDDDEIMSFLPRPTNRDVIILKPFVIEHYKCADPMYKIANHSEEDITVFVLAAFGRLDEFPRGHAYTVPDWYSIQIERDGNMVRIV